MEEFGWWIAINFQRHRIHVHTKPEGDTHQCCRREGFKTRIILCLSGSTGAPWQWRPLSTPVKPRRIYNAAQLKDVFTIQATWPDDFKDQERADAKTCTMYIYRLTLTRLPFSVKPRRKLNRVRTASGIPVLTSQFVAEEPTEKPIYYWYRPPQKCVLALHTESSHETVNT